MSLLDPNTPWKKAMRESKKGTGFFAEITGPDETLEERAAQDYMEAYRKKDKKKMDKTLHTMNTILKM